MKAVAPNVDVIPDWFDDQFFAESYLDSSQDEISPIEAYEAYLSLKVRDGVFGSAQNYIKQHSLELPAPLTSYVDAIAKAFDWKAYRMRSSDLAGFKPIDLVKHFLRFGIREPRHINGNSYLLDRRFAWTVQSGSQLHLTIPFQAVVHCYHYDVLCSLLSYLNNIARLGGSIHILVANESISSHAMDDFIHKLRASLNCHSWRRVVNYGEDWSSFHEAYHAGLFNEDGITIKMQTKRSSHLGSDGGQSWIDEALGPLCGTYWAIEQLLRNLTQGGASVQASRITKCVGFGVNAELVSSFIEAVGLPIEDKLHVQPFSAGSMFAATNQVIREFYHSLGNVDYSQVYSASPYCGRYAGHALERVFFYFCLSKYGRKSLRWRL